VRVLAERYDQGELLLIDWTPRLAERPVPPGPAPGTDPPAAFHGAGIRLDD